MADEPVPGADSPERPDFDSLVDFFGRFPSIQEVTDLLIDEAMAKADGNQTIAARLLGVSQSTLSRRMSKKEG